MIYIGTDIVEVRRIRELMARWPDRFVRRIYTTTEIDYCARQPVPAIHFAGRFAAKEAVKKALYAAGARDPISFASIGIDRTPEGIPVASWTGGDAKLQLSISHTNNHAVATALVVTND